MNNRPEGRSLQLYFIDGRPDGMLTAEVFNWTGHILMAPRTQLSAALARQEAHYAGAYILLGELDGQPLANIGEGDDISVRIKSHDINKDWWTTVVLVTSTAKNLHKAHAQYLEARLVEIAKLVGRVPLQNGNTPSRPALPEAAQSDMEGFLDYLLMVLPALRVDMFLANTRAIASASSTQEVGPAFTMAYPNHGIQARAVLMDGEFVVQAGSRAKSVWTHEGTKNSGYAQLHDELISNGVLVPDGSVHVFTKSYAFKSPSAAASVLNARYSNGPSDWKLEGTNTNYRDWEAGQLSSDEPPSSDGPLAAPQEAWQDAKPA